MQNVSIFPGIRVTLAVETVECFGEKAEKVFPLPISKLIYKVPIKFFSKSFSLSCLSKTWYY